MYNERIKKIVGNKFRSVIRSDWKTVDSNIRYLLDFLNQNELTNSILVELRSRELYGDEWDFEQLGMAGAVNLNLPDNEMDYAAISLALLEQCSEKHHLLQGIGMSISGESRFDDGIRYFNEIFTKKLHEYIVEKIEDGNLILYLLNRYKARCEWFYKKEMFHLYESDTRHGEKLLTKELRKFLFDQGIDYPFSEPETPSGRPDIIHGIGGNNPLTLEIKLFKPDQGDRAYIRQGFRQAFDYAEDYNQPFGYLLIFNLTDYTLKFTTNETSKPLKVQLGDKTIFIVTINLFVDERSSSQRRKIKPYEITSEYLKSEEQE